MHPNHYVLGLLILLVCAFQRSDIDAILKLFKSNSTPHMEQSFTFKHKRYIIVSYIDTKR